MHCIKAEKSKTFNTTHYRFSGTWLLHHSLVSSKTNHVRNWRCNGMFLVVERAVWFVCLAWFIAWNVLSFAQLHPELAGYFPIENRKLNVMTNFVKKKFYDDYTTELAFHVYRTVLCYRVGNLRSLYLCGLFPLTWQWCSRCFPLTMVAFPEELCIGLFPKSLDFPNHVET